MMEFEAFVSALRSAHANGLPGEEEQMRMSPLGRARTREALQNHPDPKESAVLIALYAEAQEIRTVLMVRNTYPGPHSAQVSFPGGKREDVDQNLEQTALREFEEETGFGSQHVEVIGAMSELFIPPSGFLVNPYVGIIHGQPEFNPDPGEVARLLLPSLNTLFAEETKTEKTVTTSGNFRLKTPCYLIEDEIVWGATAMMIREFETLCRRFWQ